MFHFDPRFFRISLAHNNKGASPWLKVILSRNRFSTPCGKERIPVSVYLVNGIKLQGQIESFDQFVVLLKNSVSQMDLQASPFPIVVPVRNVRLNLATDDDDGDPS